MAPGNLLPMCKYGKPKVDHHGAQDRVFTRRDALIQGQGLQIHTASFIYKRELKTKAEGGLVGLPPQ